MYMYVSHSVTPHSTTALHQKQFKSLSTNKTHCLNVQATMCVVLLHASSCLTKVVDCSLTTASRMLSDANVLTYCCKVMWKAQWIDRCAMQCVRRVYQTIRPDRLLTLCHICVIAIYV